MKFLPHRLALFILLLNGLFWCWFWIDVWRSSMPYAERTPMFEEVVPIYRFGEQALPSAAERDLGSFRTMYLCQRPSFFVVTQSVRRLTSQAWDRKLGSMSIGAYALLATMLLSFLQWGLVALLADRVMRWIRASQGRMAH